MMRIGILGGTFDPVHNGHLALARGALNLLKLDRVHFVPCGTPPHRTRVPEAPAEDRYEMVRRAVQGEAAFETSRLELDRPGRSYSIDTVRIFRDRFGRDLELFFLVGADCLADLDSWHRFSELVKLCRLTAVSRPGYCLARIPEGVLSIVLATPDISSSAVRQKIQRGEDLRPFLPDPVLAYIQSRRLYRKKPSP
ncbi:MAG: nicotinate-nucleotide adenylyltransferase [Candidatus Omnitrophica bacterium]|nr:nicotinate-nucleotide adenylyltransferase [Candidatus Omnitrophota bacterium]